MKASKKGPEINLSKLKPGNLKAPKALGDVYREVKGQHLLPIIVLLIAGLVAIPVLLGGSSDDGKPAGPRSQGTIHGAATKQVALDVTKWTPGVLNYKKRLRGAHRTDPFVSKVPGYGSSEPGSGSGEAEAAPPPAEIEAGSGGGEEPATTPVEPAPGGASGGGDETGNQGGDESHGGESKDESDTGVVTVDIHIFTIHEDGGIDRRPVRRDLPPQTKLPSETIPALTYVGPSDDGEKALMALSPEVTAIAGDSNCVAPGEPCSLLALQVGVPETIVFGPNGLTYRFELVRVGESAKSDAKSDRGQGAGSGSGSGPGSGSAPAPRGTNALIGIGSRRVVDRSPGF